MAMSAAGARRKRWRQSSTGILVAVACAVPVANWYLRAGADVAASLGTACFVGGGPAQLETRRADSLASCGHQPQSAVGFTSGAASLRDPHRTAHTGLVTASALAPAAASMSLPAWKRLPLDMWRVATMPYRFMKMTQITRDVVEKLKQKFKAKKEAEDKSEGSSSSGATGTLQQLLPKYMLSHVIAQTSPDTYRSLLNVSLDMIVESITTKEPFPFEPYHEAIRGPGLDLYQWGNDFFRSMVKYRDSRVEGLQHVLEIKEKLAKGANVMLLANHQTEADPQVLSILTELAGHEDLAEKCIFVAGHKVTTDPLAVPFSKGRNLLTIFSKKYLDKMDKEEFDAASARNRETVVQWQRLLKEGGHIFWVAPSGGRDRKGPSGRFEPAKFDAQSIGLFQILAQKAARGGGPETHFYPLAMWSHRLVPPPDDAKAAVGESRSAARAPIAIEFGPEMIPKELGGKKEFPGAAERIVRQHYAHLDDIMQR